MKKVILVIFRTIAAGLLCFVMADCSDDRGTEAGDTTSRGTDGNSI